MNRREVIIVERNGVYFVAYVKRLKHGRHYAAQFDSKYSTLAEVKVWIGKQGKLALVA